MYVCICVYIYIYIYRVLAPCRPCRPCRRRGPWPLPASCYSWCCLCFVFDLFIYSCKHIQLEVPRELLWIEPCGPHNLWEESRLLCGRGFENIVHLRRIPRHHAAKSYLSQRSYRKTARQTSQPWNCQETAPPVFEIPLRHASSSRSRGFDPSRLLRPVSLLRLSLLRFADSRFPGNSPWTHENSTPQNQDSVRVEPSEIRNRSAEIGRNSEGPGLHRSPRSDRPGKSHYGQEGQRIATASKKSTTTLGCFRSKPRP